MMNQEEFKQIISKAISNEIEAYTYYTAIAEKARDKSIKDIFGDLAEEESKHRIILEGFLKKTPEKFHFAESKDYRVTDNIDTPAFSPDMKLIDGIVLAIKKELEAMQMYTQLANVSADEGHKNTFLELASMERGHKNRLEDIYTNMAFPEVW